MMGVDRRAFNGMPLKVRKIFAAQESELRIQHLNFEKDRLKKRYRQSLAEINQHIANCEKSLAQLKGES